MPDAHGVEILRDAQKVFAPCELGGMMGYLTAVEEYLAKADGVPFDVATVMQAAAALEPAAYQATARQRAGGFAETFEQVVEGMTQG